MDFQALKDDFNGQEIRETAFSFLINRLKEEFKPLKDMKIVLYSDDEKTNYMTISFSFTNSVDKNHVIDFHMERDEETSQLTILDIGLPHD